MRASRSPAVVVALLVSLAVGGVASAAPADDREDARREFAAGLDADKRKDWTGALDHYLRANDLVEHPFTIYNIATDYERLGKLREAGVWYRRYLDKATDPADLARVRAQLAELELRPGPLTILSVPGGARAFVDNAPVGVTPVTVPVKGGSHRVAIEHAGQRTERDVHLEYGEAQDISISLGKQPGTLLVFGTPEGATIYVDGKPSGTLPSAQVPVEEGGHEVRVVMIGYAPFSLDTATTAGGITKVPVALSRGGSLDGSNPNAGLLLGYYLGGGGGADLGGRGAAFHGEFGVSAGHYDLGLGVGRIGSDTLVELGVRYAFGSGRFAPFLGAGYVFTPSAGAGVFGGLKLELVRSDASSIALLGQVGLYRYVPNAITNPDGSTSTSDAASAIPITVSLVAVFGRRIPTPATASPAASLAPGAQ